MSVLVARRSAWITAGLTIWFALGLVLEVMGLLFAPGAWQLVFALLLLPLSGLLHYAAMASMALDDEAIPEAIIDGSLALLTASLGTVALVRGLCDLLPA
jgi:hypothetical protein